MFGLGKMTYKTFVKKIDREREELDTQKKELEIMMENLVHDYTESKVNLLHTFDEVLKGMGAVSAQTARIRDMRRELNIMLGKDE